MVEFLDSRLMDCEFDPHQRHCIVSLSKILYPIPTTGYTQYGTSHLGHLLLIFVVCEFFFILCCLFYSR